MITIIKTLLLFVQFFNYTIQGKNVIHRVFLFIILFITPFLNWTGLFLDYELPKLLFFRICVELWFVVTILIDKSFLESVVSYLKNNFTYFVILAVVLVINFISAADKDLFWWGSYYKGFGLFTLLHFGLLACLVAYTLRSRIVSFGRDFVIIIKAVLIIMFCISLYQLCFTDILLLSEGRWIGTFGQPNFLGIFALMLLPFVVKKGITNVMAVISAILIIIFSQSRIGLGLLACFIALYLFVIFKKQKYKFVMAGIVMLVALILIITNTRFGELNLLTDFRLNIWEASIKVISENPIFGVGLDNSILYLSDALKAQGIQGDLVLDRAHNEILDWIIYLGIPSTICVVFVFLYKSLGLYSSASKHSKSIMPYHVSLVMWFAYSMVNNNSIWNYIWIVFLIISIRNYLKLNGKQQKLLKYQLTGYWYMILNISVILAVIMAILINVSQLGGDMNFEKFLDSGDENYLERAIKLRPYESIYKNYSD